MNRESARVRAFSRRKADARVFLCLACASEIYHRRREEKYWYSPLRYVIIIYKAYYGVLQRRYVMFIRDVYIDWNKISGDSYLRSIGALRGVERIHFSRPVTCFAGENGSGKSTLLEALAIADGFNPEGGTRNYTFSTRDSHSELHEAIRLSRTQKAGHGYFLRTESFYNTATMEEEYSKGPGGRPLDLHRRSHGESFLTVAQNYFRGQGIFFLDEPEAALSPQRQLTLLAEIDRSRREGSQFFIATHSPILLSLPDAEILTFDDGQIHPCRYEETDSFLIMSAFLRDRERFLKRLLEDRSTCINTDISSEPKGE